jgi:hypothetical protein
MGKYLIAISILAVVLGGTVYGADSSSVAKPTGVAIPDRFGGFVPLAGKTPRTWQVSVDNTARTLDNLVVTGSGTYLGGSDNTLTPIAATISCESTATMWAFQTTPTATVGHELAAGTSWQPSGPDALAYLRGRNTADGASASCAVTLWY